MEQYAEEYQHRAPEAPRTQYLPIANNGDIDTPDGATAPNAVDVLDRKLDKINDTTMNYDPEGLYSFCDDGCGGGCVKSAQHVPNLATEGVLTAMQRYLDALGITTAALQQHGGEQNVDRIAAVYGDEGGFDLAGIANRTNEVAKSYTDTMTSAHSSAQSALEAVRLTVKNERSKLAEKADVVHWNAKEIAGEIGFNGSPAALMKVAPRLVGGPWMLAGGAAASLAVDWWKRRKAQGLGPEVIEQGQKAAQNAIGEHAKAIEAFREEIKKLAVVPNTEIASLPTPKADEATTVSKTDPAKTEDTPTPVIDGSSTPTPESDKPAMTDQAGLDSLFPKMDDGMGGGAPMGGGMPDMGGGSPMGGMPQMGGQPTDPFADKPLDDAKDEEDPFEDEDGDQDEAKDGDEDAETNPDDDTETKPDNATDQPVTEPGDATDPPVQSTTEPVAATADPESEEARTATLPDGRSVTFPTAHQAEVARSMTEAAASGNPKSLYMAASEAGYDVPPQGQDIGEKVPPALMREGDVLSTSNGQGMYVGNGDVLMENGDISKLSDVANFDGESQGVFRLTEPEDHAGPGLDGPAQAVSADAAPAVDSGTVTGDATTTTAGSPGVPTDAAPAANDTSASLGSGNGLSSSGGAMDPNSAFPS